MNLIKILVPNFFLVFYRLWHIIGRMDHGIYFGQNTELILEKIAHIDCTLCFFINVILLSFVLSYQSVELRNKMFAKELRRGKSTNSKNQEGSPQLSNEAIDYRFDGETLILNYLTYQYIDLTYRPLQEIVNYPGGVRSSVSVTINCLALLII